VNAIEVVKYHCFKAIKRGLTQAALAAQLHMSRATISAVENGTVSEIGVRKLMALCTAVGLTLEATVISERPTLFDLKNERAR